MRRRFSTRVQAVQGGDPAAGVYPREGSNMKTRNSTLSCSAQVGGLPTLFLRRRAVGLGRRAVGRRHERREIALQLAEPLLVQAVDAADVATGILVHGGLALGAGKGQLQPALLVPVGHP